MFNKSKISKLKNLASDLQERLNLSNKLGLGFRGKRDYYNVYGWPHKVTYEEAVERYQRQDIAKRIVDAHAQETWRNYPEVSGSSAFDTAWAELMVREGFCFWNCLERADKLAGLGSFSVIFLGFDDGSNTEKEVKKGSKLIYMQPYGYGSIKIKEFDADTSSPRYGKPQIYSIKSDDSEEDRRSTPTPSLEVHWSRIIHIIENPLENNIYGTPRLLPVWNLLEDLLKVVGGSAENYWLSARGGLHINVDKELDFDEGAATQLSEEIDEFQHQLRRVIRTRGVEIAPLNHDLPDPSGAFNVIIKLISGTTGIPGRILLGSEAGQLASSADRGNWADRITERQRSFAEPIMLLPIINRLQYYGVLPDKASDVIVKWPDSYHLTPYEKSQAAAQYARAAANIAKIATLGIDFMTIGEARVLTGLEEEIPEGDIFKAELPDPSQMSVPKPDDNGENDEDAPGESNIK